MIYKTSYLIFKHKSVIVFCKYTLILNLAHASRSKTVGTEATKHWESCEMLKKYLFGRFDK